MCTKHTVTTSEEKTNLQGKHISRPISDNELTPNNTDERDHGFQTADLPNHRQSSRESRSSVCFLESNSTSGTPPPKGMTVGNKTGPNYPKRDGRYTTVNMDTFGRGRPKMIKGQNSSPSKKPPGLRHPRKTAPVRRLL